MRPCILVSAFLLLLVNLVSLKSYTVFAQNLPSLGGVAINVEVADSEAVEGDIISITKDGLKRTAVAFDALLYGVVVGTPVLSVQPKTDETKSILSSGIANVKVSLETGTIEIGDFITSSDKAGVGQKAKISGYVLGKALAKYDDNTKIGLIPVEVNIGYADIAEGGKGFKAYITSLLNNPENFRNFLRYTLGLVIGIVTAVGSIFAFVKFISTGLTALGRNPLAKGTIIGGMVIAALVVVILTIAGFGVAIAIIGLDTVTNLWRR